MKSLFYTLLLLGIPATEAFTVQTNFRNGSFLMKQQPKILRMAKKADEPTVNFKKAEFVSSVAEKTGLSKTGAEAAMQAVIETIAEVSTKIAS